ncbi:Cytosolic J-domain-containing protein [Erysiphe neolycopersici]|uniref:Cytosolic J-domain-containing protein n=1 Tax=Erysiphe neolycopersici TaxID=212602 RepID=A0A420HNL5_9PEZI|nr:Cytosolic J-domain-containing protein [Erysiphe neolycopersici]
MMGMQHICESFTKTSSRPLLNRAFYTLSKTCHPDCNPSDPQASNRFIALSAAYSILGTPSTRASYDSTLLKYHPQHEISTTRGTYSSTNPVGGRSPSGLSRRRAQFRGPPPSFYRNGGWGSFTEKRQNSHKETTNPAKSKTNSDVDAQEFGDFGPGQNLYKYVNNDDLHHFDREQHLQTQENHRKRWQSRKKGNGQIIDEDLPKGLLGPFITVAGILTIGIILPLSYLRIS